MPVYDVNIQVVADSEEEVEKLLNAASFVDGYDEITERPEEVEEEDEDED